MTPKPLPKCELEIARALTVLRDAGLVLDHSPEVAGFSAPAKCSLRIDSRQVTTGDIFLALAGSRADGHTHLDVARERGANLLIVERRVEALKGAWILVKNTRAAWAHLAAAAFDNPQNKLKMLAVTGTNGKTSVVWMIRQLLEAAGTPCLSIGTLGAYCGTEFRETQHTTPDPDVLYALLAVAVERGITVCAMEASSHAIEQEKLRPISFSACAFTSFSRDHLDFHPSMEAYFAAKWRLFTERAAPGALCAFFAGIDEINYPLNLHDKQILVYGASPLNVAPGVAFLDYRVEATSFGGTQLTVRSNNQEISGKIPYFATHALNNFAAALALSSAVDSRVLASNIWRQLQPVPGRLEQVTSRKSERPGVVVDYAHTPDALDKTLRTLRPFCAGKLAVVFGCGGDRDRGKRPQMAKIAEELADRVYLTSDNPRSEDPETILTDMRAGLLHPERALCDADRARAIARAIADAHGGDMILIAGKGHETYQILRTGTIAFDDRLVAQKHLDG